MTESYDARFHAFMLLNDLIGQILPRGAQFTKEQADAVHATAERLAKDLTSDKATELLGSAIQ